MTAKEFVEVVNQKLEKNKNNFLFDGICFSDSFGYGYDIQYYKTEGKIDDKFIKVYPVSTVYGKVYDVNLTDGFGKTYEKFAKEFGLGELNCSGIPTLFKKEDFLNHLLSA